MSRLQRCLCDLCFFLAVCAFAYAAQQGTIELSAGGVTLTDSDMHNYASFMARKAHPENFSRDFALADASPAVSYPTVQEWIASAIMPPDQYAVGMLSVLGGCLVVFYCGWYWFGIILFHSRRLACLLSLAMGITIYVGWGTFWGITGPGPLARTLFTAAVPWLMGAAWLLRASVWGQRGLLFVTGCLTAVHSVSAVSFGCALCMGLCVCKKADQSYLGFFGHLLLCFLLFALPAVGFIFFMMPMPHVNLSPESIATLQEMFRVRFAEDFGGQPLHWFLTEYCLHIPLIPLGLLAAGIGYYKGDSEQKTQLLLALFWTLGLIILVSLDPLIRILVASMSNAVPATYELHRAMRFVPMLMILLIFMCVAPYWRQCRQWCRTAMFSLLVPVGILCYGYEPVFLAAVYHSVPSCPLYQKSMASLAESHAQSLLHRQALEQVQKHVGIHELVFSNSGDLAIRHIALRSLSFTFKDGLHPFHNKNAAGSQRWMDINAAMRKSPTAYIQVWLESDAEWLLLDNLADLPNITGYATIVWQNAAYALLKKNRAQSAP